MLLEVRWDTRGSKETAAGRKCKTEAGPTPPQSKKKRKAPAGETFGQAERDNLLGVVSVEAYPYTALEKAQLDYVREQLMERLEKSIDSGTTIPQFLSANFKCMSEMCCTWLTGNTGRKKSPFWHHRTTLSGSIFATKACIDNRKKLVKQQYPVSYTHLTLPTNREV